MGRPRKPTSLKLLDGDRKDRINRSEPRSPPGLGEPPDWLDDCGRSAWARLAEKLGPMGVSTRADAEAAAVYCQAYSTWRKATVIVNSQGFTVETDTTTKVHPAFAVLHEAQKTMLRVLTQFGMTPSSRSGLHVQEPPEDDPLLAYLAGNKTGTADGKKRR